MPTKIVAALKIIAAWETLRKKKKEPELKTADHTDIKCCLQKKSKMHQQ